MDLKNKIITRKHYLTEEIDMEADNCSKEKVK
jgi:hypothetical protein